jgi:hypothetical protein
MIKQTIEKVGQRDKQSHQGGVIKQKYLNRNLVLTI